VVNIPKNPVTLEFPVVCIMTRISDACPPCLCPLSFTSAISMLLDISLCHTRQFIGTGKY
jgi:hypothetical protein